MRPLCDPSLVNNSPKVSKPSIHIGAGSANSRRDHRSYCEHLSAAQNLTPEQIESRPWMAKIP